MYMNNYWSYNIGCTITGRALSWTYIIVSPYLLSSVLLLLPTLSMNITVFKHGVSVPRSFLSILGKRYVSYVQGQSPEPKIREYFYYIDHQGMLFLDDSRMKNFTSCFKEKKFLDFFFKRIQLNKTGRYQEFPFISLCGRERNYIRCDDVPIVYTHIIAKSDGNLERDHLVYGYAGDNLTSIMTPEKIYMMPLTGRVYHPAEDVYGGVGLIKSKLAIEISKFFEFHNGETHPPTHFTWKNNRYQLDQNWFHEKIQKFNLKIKTEED